MFPSSSLSPSSHGCVDCCCCSSREQCPRWSRWLICAECCVLHVGGSSLQTIGCTYVCTGAGVCGLLLRRCTPWGLALFESCDCCRLQLGWWVVGYRLQQLCCDVHGFRRNHIRVDLEGQGIDVCWAYAGGCFVQEDSLRCTNVMF